MSNQSWFSPEQTRKIFADLEAKKDEKRTPEQIQADLDIKAWAEKAKREKEIFNQNEKNRNGKKY